MTTKILQDIEQATDSSDILQFIKNRKENQQRQKNDPVTGIWKNDAALVDEITREAYELRKAERLNDV